MSRLDLYPNGKTPPCKDCTDRKHGCHAGCEKYCSWKQEYQAEKKAARDQQDKNNMIDGHIVDSWAAGRKRYQKKTGKARKV